MSERLFEIALAVVCFGTLHWFSFKMLTAVAWGTIEVSATAYKLAHQALIGLPSPDWHPRPGVIAAAGWAFGAGCLASALLLARSGPLAGWAGMLPLGALIGMFLSAVGVALFKRRAAGPLRRGEQLAVILTVFSWSPFWLVLFAIRD